MSEPKFKVGDRVLVTDLDNGVVDLPATIDEIYSENKGLIALFYGDEIKPDPDYAEPEDKDLVNLLIRAVEDALKEFKRGDAVRHIVEFALRDEKRYEPF